MKYGEANFRYHDMYFTLICRDKNIGGININYINERLKIKAKRKDMTIKAFDEQSPEKDRWKMDVQQSRSSIYMNCLVDGRKPKLTFDVKELDKMGIIPEHGTFFYIEVWQ